MLHYKTIHPTTLELLKTLQKVNELSNFRLVGGTALSLQLGHRISVDLDLFSYNSNEDFLSIISSIKELGLHIEIRQQSSNILIAFINGIKVDIVNYPFHWIEKELNKDDITMANTKDIAAMKLSAITNRGTRKDFIDLFYLFKSYTLSEMLQFYSKKYNNASTFMVLKSLTYFDDAESDAMPLCFDENFSWDIVKASITKEVKQIT